jgi:hemoglobin
VQGDAPADRREDDASVYEAVGGMAFFVALTDRFYAGVARDPVLLAVYPTPKELGPARRHLALFLAQYWGGPDDYDAERGHPRLRMRHEPFAIGPEQRDRWLFHMQEALDAADPAPEVRSAMMDHFVMAAEALRNRG